MVPDEFDYHKSFFFRQNAHKTMNIKWICLVKFELITPIIGFKMQFWFSKHDEFECDASTFEVYSIWNIHCMRMEIMANFTEVILWIVFLQDSVWCSEKRASLIIGHTKLDRDWINILQ